MAALKFWTWLTTLPGLSSRSRLLLLEHFQSPEDIYYADTEELLLAEGMTRAQAELLGDKSLDRAERVLEECARKEQFILTMQDAAYPNRLRGIYDPPVLLYGRGALPLFDEEAAIAVVGTRSCTPYGVAVAEEFGYEMAKQGALVVSGMARGIDAAAQRGALRAGGLTAAVLGGGVDVVYPAENRWLYEDIAAVGVLLSEYPPGTEPRSGHFPVRNRIMSGLTLASVVVEAPPRSGALITAHLALDQGRDVFAVPGPITAEASRGCNELIREGAGLASCAWDILGEYEARFPLRLHKTGAKLPPMPEGSEPPQPSPPAQKPQAEREEKPTLPVLDLSGDHGLTDEQLLVLRTLSTTEPMLTDDLALRTDLPMRRVLSALTILEIDGLTCEAGARCFLRAVELKE